MAAKKAAKKKATKARPNSAKPEISDASTRERTPADEEERAPRLGRPSKMTAETAAKVLAALADRPIYARAAAKAGIARSTLSKWRAEDQEFSNACEAACWDAIDSTTDKMLQAAARELPWQAYSWLLERTRPGDFGRNRAGNDDTIAPPPPRVRVEVDYGSDRKAITTASSSRKTSRKKSSARKADAQGG